MLQQKIARLILCCAVLLLCTSCEYDNEFDALSSFPNNGEKLDIREMDFVEVRSAKKYEMQETAVPETTEQFKQYSKIKISERVAAFTLGQPRKEALSRGKFTRLSSVDTGIIEDPVLEFDETNADKLRSPFTATGIAIGDLNGDSLPDLFIANQYRGGRLFRNQGDMKFVDVTASVGIKIDSMWGTSVTLVDINNDGLLDIYICGYDSANRLYVNRGRKFSEEAERYGLAFKGACVGASFADYDRDGDLDAYLLTNRLTPENSGGQVLIDREPGQTPRVKEGYREISRLIPSKDGDYLQVPSGQFDYLMRNNGFGFTDVSDECLIGKQPYHGMSTVWCDFNNDQWPDLYVTNDHKDPDQLFENLGPNADGEVTFKDVSEEVLAKTTWFAKGVELSDLNSDGVLDFMVAGNLKAKNVDRINSQGNLFGSDRWFMNWGQTTQRFGNSISINNGNGPFADVGHLSGLAATGWTSSIRAGDFDNDGMEDLLFANGNTRPFLDNDLNRVRRKLGADKTTNSSDQFWLGKDLAPATNMVYKNQGGLQFENVGEPWGLGQDGVAQVAAVADLDGDGDLDTITTGYKDSIHIYRNDINADNVIAFRLGGVQSNTFCVGAEIRITVDAEADQQVRRLVTSRGFMASEAPIAHFGVGDAESVELVEIVWPNGVVQNLRKLKPNLVYRIQEPETKQTISKRRKLDFDSDLFAAEKELFGGPVRELEFDDFERQPLQRFGHSQQGPCLVWADIDGDDDFDLFIGGSLYESARVYVNQGQGRFKSIRRETFEDDAASEDVGAVFFDYDGDGDQDLYVVSGGVETKAGTETMQDRLYRNNGLGRFERATAALPELAFSGAAVSVGDFDNDQRLDLFVGGRVVPGQYPATPRSALLRNTGNEFVDVTEEYAEGLKDIGMVTGCNWSDVDADGKLDLMVTTELGPVHCFLNRGDRLEDVTEAVGLGERRGFYNSIAAGDVDNDGDTDFVVGNLGTNTSLSVSDSDPRIFYSGRFGGLEKTTLVEALIRDGQEFAADSFDAILEALPQLEDSFESSKQFAKTPLNKIFAADVLAEAVRLEVNSLQSGLLINESEPGRPEFNFRPLPYLAQTSPIAGAQLCDFDGDGYLDLYVLQNNSNVNERHEALDSGDGLLMLGDGTGQFTPLVNGAGVSVSGDGTALTTMDINEDGKADLVAAVTSEAVKTFENQSGHSPFAINLTKLRKGKNYIGAKVLIVFENGRKQLHEIHSSNGHLSQAPPVVFTGLNFSKNEIQEIQIQWPDGDKISGTIKDLYNK